LATSQVAELNEFVGPKPIGVIAMSGRSVWAFGAVPEVGAARTLVGRTNAIAPVVAVGETAAGKADDRGLDLAHGFYQLGPDAIHVLGLGIPAYPDAVINDSAEVFREMAVDVWGDDAEFLSNQHLDAARGSSGRSPCRITAVRQRLGHSGRRNSRRSIMRATSLR